MHAHGRAIGAVLKENADTAGVLVSALEKAVSAVKAEPGAPAAAPAASAAPPEAPSEPVPALESGPEPKADGSDVPASFRVRLRAWWNGVDPDEAEATAE